MNLEDRKYAAHCAVTLAVSRGILKRAQDLLCLGCGNQENLYHHDRGYDKKDILSVVPLCTACHAHAHRNIRFEGYLKEKNDRMSLYLSKVSV